jgi:hypothetical protein
MNVVESGGERGESKHSAQHTALVKSIFRSGGPPAGLVQKYKTNKRRH